MIVPMGWFGWVRIGALQMDVITLGETLPSVGGKIWQVSTIPKKKCLSSGIEIFMVLNILLLFLKFVKEVGTIFQK